MQKWKNEFNLCVFVMTLPSLDDKKKKNHQTSGVTGP